MSLSLRLLLASALLVPALACKSKNAAPAPATPAAPGTAAAATTAAPVPATAAAPAKPGSLGLGKAPKAPVPLSEYFKIRRVRRAAFSHDESLFAYESDVGGRMDIWVQPVGGGEARQLTHTTGYLHSFSAKRCRTST